MNGITVPMALVDFMPVILFFIAAVILQKDLYNKMTKGAFALLSSGSIMVLLSGIYKALWKILYALNICDYKALDTSFFVMQGPGFLLVFLSLVIMLSKSNKKADNLMAIGTVPAYTSNIPFIALQTIGCAGVQWSLFAIAVKMKKAVAAVLFVVAFVFMLGMGYLSATFDDSSNMHWIAQVVNIVSQLALFGGVFILHKNGLSDPDSLKEKEVL